MRCTSPSCAFDGVDLTDEALTYDEAQVWNAKVAFVEKTASFVYTADGGFVPVPIASREQIDMIMSKFSQISAQTWLKQPSCNRYHQQSFYPSLTPPEAQYGLGKELNLFTGFAIPNGIAQATPTQAQAQSLLDHIRTVWCKGSETHYR